VRRNTEHFLCEAENHDTAKETSPIAIATADG